MAPNSQRSPSDPSPRVPLRLEFHYEVDELGETYRVWEEQRREPLGIGGDTERVERRVNERHA